MKLTTKDKVIAFILTMLFAAGLSLIAAVPAEGATAKLCTATQCGQLYNYGSYKILTKTGSIGEYIYPGGHTQRNYDYDYYYVPKGKCYTVSVRGYIYVKCGGTYGKYFSIAGRDIVQAYPHT